MAIPHSNDNSTVNFVTGTGSLLDIGATDGCSQPIKERKLLVKGAEYRRYDCPNNNFFSEPAKNRLIEMCFSVFRRGQDRPNCHIVTYPNSPQPYFETIVLSQQATRFVLHNLDIMIRFKMDRIHPKRPVYNVYLLCATT